jgi:hypothetical protein
MLGDAIRREEELGRGEGHGLEVRRGYSVAGLSIASPSPPRQQARPVGVRRSAPVVTCTDNVTAKTT